MSQGQYGIKANEHLHCQLISQLHAGLIFQRLQLIVTEINVKILPWYQ